MQSANDVLSLLFLRGVKIWTERGQLRLQALKGGLAPEEIDQIRVRKAEIIEILENQDLMASLPLQPRDHGHPIPLTALQRRVFNYLLEQKRLSTRMCAIVARVLGPLNVDVLRNCVDLIVQRHESLRTRFTMVDGVLRQQVDAGFPLQMELVDIGEITPDKIDLEIRRLAEALVEERVDLSVGPLFVAKIYRLSRGDHLLLLAMDHMISDGASMQILHREIWTLYYQSAQGMPLYLPKLPVQFADYAVWQERIHVAWRKSEVYWKEHLSGAPRIQIPRDDDLAKVTQRGDAARLGFLFGDLLSTGLRQLARRERVVPALVLLAVFITVMSRWCKQSDVTLMFTSHGRYRSELVNTIGFIAHQVFLRVKINEEDRAIDLVQRVSHEYSSALAHHDYDRVPDVIPGFSSELYFNCANADWKHWSVNDLKGSHDQVRVHAHPFRKPVAHTFGCFFSDTDTEIVCRVEYRTDFFHAATVERFGDNIRSVAERFVEYPGLVL